MAKYIVTIICFVIVSACSEVRAEKECSYIHSFLKSTSKLMISLPFHTYPVFNLCTNQEAQAEYRNATIFYRNMTKAPECNKYLENNRMTVYQTIYAQLTGLWDSANCDACASAVNETAKFMNLSATLDKCFASTNTPCESCDTDYQNVQQFYAGMDKKQHGSGMCFDIEDRMNETRRVWSGQYNCCKDKRRSMVIFASIASVVCVLPFVFYVLMHVVTIRQERRRISLLTATSVNDEPDQPSSSRPNNGALRNSEMERIEEANGNEENDDDDSDYDADSILAKAVSLPPLTKLNNLDVKEGNLLDIEHVKEGNLLDIAELEQSSLLQSVPQPVGRYDHHQDDCDDVSLLK